MSQLNLITVLIADDQPLIRTSLKTVLNQSPDQIQLVGDAENGKEAVELANRLQPNVILMDIGMPIMDGIEATRAIKQTLKDTKVVILTTHEDEAEIMSAFRSGAHSYCLKDTPMEQMVDIIQSTWHGASWIDPKIAQVVIRHSIQSPAETATNNSKPDLIAPLTPREIEVLQLIADGKNNTEITETLHLSLNTVKTHVKNIFMKLDVQDRTAAALKAIREQLVESH